jgi:osmotically-inducible protein OsmY
MKTDTQLKQDVIAELEWEPAVNAAQIGVEVTDGVVTLSGSVSAFAEKWHAEQAAQRVAGVDILVVDMDVKLSGAARRDDADIARAADTLLLWATSLPANSIKVMVDNGWITLTGAAHWQYQKQSATDSVRYLAGVTGVSNQIVIKPRVSLNAVKTEIEAALTRVAKADAQKILVDVEGTNVTLTGTVRNWSERELATHAAWGTPGVYNVEDKMTLAL